MSVNRQKTPRRISNAFYLIFCVLVFLPINLHAEPCQDYKDELARAGKSCDWEKIEEIGEIADSYVDACLCELVEEAKCSYFFSCASKELNRAYKNCDIEEILSVRNLVDDEMIDCPSIFNMRERVMGVKCLYYDICDKKVMRKQINDCDQKGFLGTIETLISGLMDDCPDYDSIKNSLRQQKSDYFYSCIKDDLLVVSENCDLKTLQQIDSDVTNYFSDSYGSEDILALTSEFTCSHFDRCLASDIKYAADGCDIEKIVELEDLSLSGDARKCSFDPGPILTSLVDAKTKYYKSCAAKNIKQAYMDRDFQHIDLLLKSLTTYPNNETKHNLLREKAEIFSEVVKNKFNVGMESCNLDTIVRTEEYVKKEKDLPNLQQIEEWAVMAKCNYFANCVEGDLDRALSSCNLELILGIEVSAKKIKGVSGCVDVDGLIKESKCRYFADCTAKDLDEAIAGCDEKHILEIDALIKSGIVDDCANASKIPGQVRQAKLSYFTKCTEGKIYKALDKCNLDELLAFEEDIYRKYHNDQGYENVSKVVREIKCSYIEKCMNKEIDYLAHNCENERIEEIEDMVEGKMGDCPNYEIFKSTIMKVKEQCTPVSTVGHPPDISMNRRDK